MKKLLLAALCSISLVGIVGAWGRHRSCNQTCETTCETVCCEEKNLCAEPPICTKTIMVPKTIQVPKVIQVPARKILIPQPDIIERIPQAPRKICIKQPPIPQPDIIRYECVPDKIVCKKQPPIVRYECPVGTNENKGECCETSCK